MSSFIPSSVKLQNSLDVCDRTLTYVDCLMKKPKPLLLYHGSRKSSVDLNLFLFHLHEKGLGRAKNLASDAMF